MTLRWDRFLNFIYTWVLERVEDRKDFDALLVAPLSRSASRVKAPSRADLESEGDDFMSFMGQMTGR